MCTCAENLSTCLLFFMLFVFCYSFDGILCLCKVIEAILVPRGQKRGYTMSIYLDVNDRCSEVADCLGKGWNNWEVGRAMWSAARNAAASSNKMDGENDLSQDKRLVQKNQRGLTKKKK